MSTSETEDAADAGRSPKRDDHLATVPDGCGCAEVWEHLSDRRA